MQRLGKIRVEKVERGLLQLQVSTAAVAPGWFENDFFYMYIYIYTHLIQVLLGQRYGTRIQWKSKWIYSTRSTPCSWRPGTCPIRNGSSLFESLFILSLLLGVATGVFLNNSATQRARKLIFHKALKAFSHIIQSCYIWLYCYIICCIII